MTRLLPLRRTLAAAALAPLLITGVAACNDSGSDASSGSGHTASDTASSAQPAAGDVQPGDKVKPADFTDRLADGFDNLTTAHLTMKAGLGGTGTMTGDGDVDYTGDQPAVAMKLSAPMLGGEVETRLVDGAMYLNMGDLSHGKFWKVDLQGGNSPFGALGKQLDPKSSLDNLGKGLESVTYVGDDGGLAHYRAKVDPQAILDGLGGAPQAGAANLPKTIDYDMWLDDQNRMTKLVTDMGNLGSVEMSMSDFGTDVSIEAPPASDVAPMPDLSGLGGATGQPAA